MGMYDTLDASEYPLPMPNSKRWKNFRTNCFQTKSLECMLLKYRLSADGELQIPRVRDDLDPDDLVVLKPSDVIAWDRVPYTGDLFFYDLIEKSRRSPGDDHWWEDHWLEFRGVFRNGHLIAIERISPPLEDGE